MAGTKTKKKAPEERAAPRVVAGELFSEIWGQWTGPATAEELALYPFRVRCALMYRRPPRHPYFEFGLDLGMAYIDKVLRLEPLEGVLTFVFPERWMNQAEQQGFTYNLTKNPTVDKITGLDLITHAPFLVGSFKRTMVRICKFEDDYLYEPETYIKQR